jgi:putative sigma-54 modulation protein
MNLNISFKQMDSSDALKEFIREKSQTLEKYFHGRISVNWNLTIEKKNRVAHCHLLGNNMDFFGEGVTEDFKASIDEALDRIEKQVRKRKEIVKDHLHRNGHRVPAAS